MRGLKVFVGILSLLWDVVKVFGGKLLYFMLFLGWAGGFEPTLPADQVYLFRLLLLTFIGTLINTGFADATYERYYAINLLRMDARDYTLTQFCVEMLKVIVGFLPFSLVYGWNNGVPVWFSLFLPLCVAGGKITAIGLELRHFEKHNGAVKERNLLRWGVSEVVLVLTYGLPMLGVALPKEVSMGLLLAMPLLGLLTIPQILHFKAYRPLNQQVLRELFDGTADVKNQVKDSTHEMISNQIDLSSSKKGFEYLNELFIKRHRKLLWRATGRISLVCAVVSGVVIVLPIFMPALKPAFNDMVLTVLSYSPILLYFINRGTGITRALFINCDHSLLTYSFYKQPHTVLKLFRIRLREISKINALPALVIGLGMDGALLTSGGGTWVEHLVIPVTVISLSLFFSIHYLTLYYLLQPFNAGTEIKSGTYQFCTGATYFVCYLMMQIRAPAVLFGLLCIGFCAAYSIIASVLVYRFAPRTFRIRQ